MIDFLYCFDKNYNVQACVSIFSLLENISEKINIHIIHKEPETFKNIPNKISDHKNLSSFNIYKFENTSFAFPNIDGTHVSEATYYRFFIEDFIDPKIKNLVYLDSDIVCIKDPLDEIKYMIKEINKSDTYISAKSEPQSISQNLNLSSGKYFNAGVMIINIQSWYENQLESKLIRFDMSEYQERHSVSKLIGAPPGYVGHAEGKMGQGQLLSSVEDNPNCVLLLDEVEKAAPEVLQVLLQVMDDGRLTGATGKTTDFTNVVLLMTSNLGAADAEKLKIGFGKNTKVDTDVKAVKSFFTPEFRNRIDAVIRFNKLDTKVVEKIVRRLEDEINEQLKDKNITIKLDKDAIEYFVEEGYEPTMGARPLKRLFENKLKKPLSKKILFEDMKNLEVTVKLVDGEINIETNKPKEL